jgi:UDP-N-acetylmuramate: L-alanyl-gamma-D-glutamyl-meso-diaminopimelate ligase
VTLRHVHFVAIAGTGMGSLAGLLAARGLEVTGSDENVYPPMSDALAGWGIPVSLGFAAENVTRRPPDLIVIGNAVRATNPEAQAALASGVRCLSFPDALRELAIDGKHSIVVAGTHGKTTTTSLLATLLLETGCDPSVLVGGISANLGGSFREGKGAHFVVEGDEYDTAFFDKTPKFLHYAARTAVLTSVEFDHADIYRDLDHVKQAFRALVAGMPADGAIVACDAPNVRDVASDAPCRVLWYAVKTEPGAADPAADWIADALEVTAEGTRFRVRVRASAAAEHADRGSAFVPAHGAHNVANALAALAAAEIAAAVPLTASIPALAHFAGVKRRQEVRGVVRGVTVIDDFAHHPTAVRETIAAVRAQYAGRPIVAVFEPRTNTSRRRVFQRAYAEAFDGVARAVIAVVADAPIYSATGEVTERFSADELAADLRARHVAAEAIDGADAIADRLARELRAGDVVLAMSNGAFGGFWDKLLVRLRETSEPGGATTRAG